MKTLVAPSSPQLKTQLWRRIIRHRYLEHYNRLVLMVFAINAYVAYQAFGFTALWPLQVEQLQLINTMVLLNFAVAVFSRQQYVINGLFWLATRAPLSWPLWIRWTLGKVYHFGGLHSGSATAGSVWYLLFVVSLLDIQAHANAGLFSTGAANALVLSVYASMALLLMILIMAAPQVRRRYHNQFEISHRFGGWAVLILFWLQSYLQAESWLSFVTSAPFYLLSLMTLSVILPWLRLKKVKVNVTTPSNHVALSQFDYGVTPFAGSSTTISHRPLFEWHAFANVPSPGKPGFRLTISRAGDWTGQFIDQAPSHVWVKGIPTAGVANIETLFKRVVYVATGSGIGPCLPHLLAQQVPASLIWSTRHARNTYGEALVDEILTTVPDALIWDTQARGKPDLVQLAYQACQATGAEAVICIANQPLTQKVVYELEVMGIPAYGAIWDS